MRISVIPALIALFASPAFSQVRYEEAKVVAADGAAGDSFGQAIAAYEETIVIGCPMDGDNGANSGSCYLYDATSSLLLMKLLPSNGSSGDEFGSSVAISGNIALVGAPGKDSSGVDSGSAYLFNVTTGAQLAMLVPGDGAPGDNFGSAVTLEGDTAFVGAPRADSGYPDSGVVYKFAANTGFETGKITHPAPDSGSEFGSSVSFTAPYLSVGAPLDDYGGIDSGSVYVFDATTGGVLNFLIPADSSGGNHFGHALSSSSTQVLIGAPNVETSGNQSGAAYLIDLPGGSQIRKLAPCDNASYDSFGWSVSMLRNTAVIGASRDVEEGVSSGSAYLYGIPVGQEVIMLLASDGEADDLFGHSVALSRVGAVVGSVADGDAGPDSGSVYLFDSALTRNPGAGYCFGDGTGTSCPCTENGNPGEGCLNSTGSTGATLVGLGNASRSDDSFYMQVEGVPGAKPGVIYQGISQHLGGMGAPVGDGLLCLTGVTERSQIQVTQDGAATFSDFQGLPFSHSIYGVCIETNYQFWYRDPLNTCTGSGFNFSNGWSVVWRP
jgi:hypothetical protein